jgi:DNA/RNA-binding domain of Phe-tRNA-synthetase-like protein
MSELTVTISPDFHRVYPGAHVGVLLLENVVASAESAALEQAALSIEDQLRRRFVDKTALRAHPVLQAYKEYYKKFDKTYHVQSQLESVVFGGRSIPRPLPLVQAMFMAELDNMLLTAGHDLAALSSPLAISLGREDLSYILMNGSPQVLKNDDMCMSDQSGVISSVIYGPDQRTRLSPAASDAMFVVYAPDGIPEEAIHKHFSDIASYVRLFAPAVVCAFSRVF